MDIGVYDLAAALLDELTDALALTRAGAPDAAVVHPGDIVPGYYGQCSLAAVRVVTIIAETGQPKRTPEFQAVYEMTVDRCYPTPENNAMPTLAQLDSLTRDDMEDAGAMRKAAACAWGTRIRSFGTWTPRGPSGGWHGGAMQVTATGLTLVCGCDDLTPWGGGIDSRIPPLAGDPRTTEGE